MVRRLFLVVLVCVLALPVVGVGPAAACSCQALDDEGARSLAYAVLAGDVIGYEELGDGNRPGDGAAIWTLAVTRVFKGRATPTVRIASPIGGASCGLEIPRSGSALVFANGISSPARRPYDEISLTANLCGGTRPLDSAPIPEAFGDGTEPRGLETQAFPVPPARSSLPATQSDTPWLIFAATTTAAALVGILIGVVIGRRRRPSED